MAKIYTIKKRKPPARSFAKDGTFEVRDFRDKGFFIVDDVYLNGWVKICGRTAALVYFVLCRHADRDQASWPSVYTISAKVGASARTVRRALKRLSEHKIIAIEEREGTSNKYHLLDKSCWVSNAVQKSGG